MIGVDIRVTVNACLGDSVDVWHLSTTTETPVVCWIAGNECLVHWDPPHRLVSQTLRQLTQQLLEVCSLLILFTCNHCHVYTFNANDDDDEIAYYTLRWKTRKLVLSTAPKTWTNSLLAKLYQQHCYYALVVERCIAISLSVWLCLSVCLRAYLWNRWTDLRKFCV